MKMTPEMLAFYLADRSGMDATVRRHFQIPEDRYYGVVVFPTKLAGTIHLYGERIVKNRKISKSDSSVVIFKES